MPHGQHREHLHTICVPWGKFLRSFTSSNIDRSVQQSQSSPAKKGHKAAEDNTQIRHYRSYNYHSRNIPVCLFQIDREPNKGTRPPASGPVSPHTPTGNRAQSRHAPAHRLPGFAPGSTRQEKMGTSYPGKCGKAWCSGRCIRHGAHAAAAPPQS